MDNVVSLPALFQQRLFQIPDYQRGYSWERQQVGEFLDDLELIGPGRFHYTGTVVLHESESETSFVMNIMDEEGNAYKRVNVVDGQQRLTTIVILLDSIRRCLDELSDRAKVLSGGIRKSYVATNGTDGQPLLKLSLNQDTDHFFKSSILAGGGVEGAKIASERRLEDAKQQIADYLSNQLKAQGKAAEDWLRTLYGKVVTQLRFTLYQVENEADVGVIFEVMNDRGKPLTDLEKVKNFLLHTSYSIGIENELAKTVNDAWGAILRRLMAANLESGTDENRLLRAHWLTYYDHQPKQWNGSRSIKDRFDLRQHAEPRTDLLDELHRYVEGLRESSVAFCDAFRPTHSDAFKSFAGSPTRRAEVVEWSDKLRRVGVVAPFLPLLIATRKRWPKDAAKYLEIVKLCETFAFRVYRLAAYRADAGQPVLFHIGYDLASRSESYDGAISRLKGVIQRYCNDEQFETLISAGHQNIKTAYQQMRGLRYFLYEYETSLARQAGDSPKVRWDEILRRDLKDTVEHILPQSIDDQPYWKRRFRGRSHERNVHDLGNLTLTKHNSTLSNKSFTEKKGSPTAKEHCYSKSSLYIERELTQWDHWTPEAIEERRTKLLEWVRERWGVDLPGNGENTDFEPEDDDGYEED